MADTLREKLIEAVSIHEGWEESAVALVDEAIIPVLDEHCGDEEPLKHLLRRAIGLLRGATFEYAENKITAAIVIEEGLQAVGYNTK